MTHITDREARYLVDRLYAWQDERKRSIMQVREAERAEEPSATTEWLARQFIGAEKEIVKQLTAYVKAHPVGQWLMSIHGIGPIISAGLLAHIDISVCPTAGHIWAFAGYGADGQKPWNRGEKRPWNATFKTLCWNIGQSFMKNGGYYGTIYRTRKAYEIERNERGDLADQAAKALAKLRDRNTPTYKLNAAGKLSPAHIDARARRYAVKRFLADLHGVWYEFHYGKPPPLPYPVAHMGHVHVVPAPAPQPAKVGYTRGKSKPASAEMTEGAE